MRKAAALTEAGDTEAARSCSSVISHWSRMTPSNSWRLAILYSDDEQYEQAYAAYREAEQIDRNSGGLRLNWGSRRCVRATSIRRAQLEHLERLESGSARPLLLRAFICEEEHELAAARRCYADALARVQPSNTEELVYALEMAMDFSARNGMRANCEKLMRRAYAANACTAELCEPYREVNGDLSRTAIGSAWWSKRIFGWGCLRCTSGPDGAGRPRRYQRRFQVIARNHDEAIDLVSARAASRRAARGRAGIPARRRFKTSIRGYTKSTRRVSMLRSAGPASLILARIGEIVPGGVTRSRGPKPTAAAITAVRTAPPRPREFQQRSQQAASVPGPLAFTGRSSIIECTPNERPG